MAKPEWGTKRTCLQCATRFYDMKKKPPVCPKCGAVFEIDTSAKSRRSRAAADEKARRAVPTPELIDDIPLEADSSEDTMIEDVDELGEDDIDMDEVVDREDSDDMSS